MAAEKLAVVLGTEGDGLSDGTIAACDYTVRIPMTHGVDSLNVAAASAVVDFYKERAKSLCQSIYNATGALPQFPNTSGEAQG